MILVFDEDQKVTIGIDQHGLHERIRMNYLVNYVQRYLGIRLLDGIDEDQYLEVNKDIVFYKEKLKEGREK